jgi:minor histocompatibility antigen H13
MSETNTFASLAETVIEKAQEILTNIVKNTFKPLSENVTLNTNTTGNETEKFKATTEGLALAYSSLVVMALIPIVLGSFKSVRHQKHQKVPKEKLTNPTVKPRLVDPGPTHFQSHFLFGF